MDSPCPAVLRSQMILVTTRVLQLGEAVAAGEDVAAEVGALAAVLEGSKHEGYGACLRPLAETRR